MQSPETLPHNTQINSGLLSSGWTLAISVCVIILLGSFTYSIYPVPVNLAAFLVLIGLFYFWLERADYISFFIQLIIGNFFIFGAKYGGNYNITAALAILLHYVAKGSLSNLGTTPLSKRLLGVLFFWWLIQVLSVVSGNDFTFLLKINSIWSFSLLIYLFYFSSLVILTEQKVLKIIQALTLFFFYLFLVALNQKYRFISYDLPFFPLADESIDFDLDIVRSTSTLNNFEAYAEYCVSFIAILFPSVISGSLIKKNKTLYWLVLIALMTGVLALVLTATRSSMLLLPFIILASIIMLGRRARIHILLKMSVGAVVLFIVNSFLNIVDFSVFIERSNNIDFKHLTIDKMLSGEEMNRGSVFKYAWQQVYEANPIIGRGYFSTPDEYRYTHFPIDNIGDGVADYHNIFFSSYVLWGIIGVLCLFLLFLSILYKGIKIYWKLRKEDSFLVDLILGFTIMFFFFLVNQFKIQFIRDVNYFMIILLLLSLFFNIIRLTKKVYFDRPTI